ncbi:MAG: DUF6505 family protein [Rhizobiaceae bacterium]
MKLLKTIQIDPSDNHVFEHAAGSGEWAIAGGFSFAGITEDALTGKVRQAFSNGFLSLESSGHSTFTVVANIEDTEVENLIAQLSQNLIDYYGAPTQKDAREAAQGEVSFIVDMCEEIPINSVFTLLRTLDDDGQIKEEFRIVDAPGEALHARVWDVEED